MALAINAASARNRRRAQRRRARLPRLRMDYIRQSVAVIEVWTAATRANAGRLPAGLVADAALVAIIEKAISSPWRLIPSVLLQ